MPTSVSLFMTGTPNQRGGLSIGRVSYVNVRDMTSRLETARLGAAQGTAASVAGNNRPPRLLAGQFVSGSYFDVLGVRMQTGRAIGPHDDLPSNAELVAVISDATWGSLFDRSPAAVGQTITVNGHRVTVVGVADAAFQGELRMSQVAFWMPGATELVIRALEGRRADDRAAGGYYQFVARLTAGASWPQAEAELASLTRWLLEQHPTDNAKFSTVGFHNRGPIGDYGREPLVRLLGTMFVAAVLVLFIASANAASLMLMRGLGRQEEFAVRRTLGATRWRVVRQHLTETTLLWGIGAMAGLLPVWLLLKSGAVSRLTSLGLLTPEVHLDWQVVGFAAALAFLVGLVFSLVPAWKSAALEPTATLQTMGTTATHRLRAAPVLTVVQLAACLTLLVGALMLGSTLRHLMSVDLGFEPENVTVFQADVSPGTSDTAAQSYLGELTRRLAAHPGVGLVAMAKGAPFYGAANVNMRVRRDAADDYVDTRMHEVLSPEYFSALGIRLVRGRAFTADELLVDREATRAVILSESLSRRLFGSVDVVGQTILEPLYQRPEATRIVVGVAAEVRVSSLIDDPAPVFYGAGGALGFSSGATVIVRTEPGAEIQQHVRAVVASLGNAPPVDIPTLEEAVARARGEWDVLAWLMWALAFVASTLSAVGVYGVVAFAAASRRTEFGIRMALGASVSAVRCQVLRGAAPIAAAGLVLGLGGAYGLMQVLRSRLVGVSPLDPIIWSSAAILLVALVAAASLIPARRATRVSLAETLKAK